MARWIFEPGHTAAEFRARHMMVTYVRGHFKNVHGTLVFDSDWLRLCRFPCGEARLTGQPFTNSNARLSLAK